ncbi:LysR family transcriptional regulator [Mailhella massiliensis]|uniref:LysR family transcriptional regulator n=1 Tax=Mailhella massiliensis TaxID=1903261 RepID=A0A921AWT5_9BACT|nr:LysR family transcriptional regulator [Mailhella massiliensis]HJD97583.1 LysR family transcriptional regulator [Mailhella massiliensis]
MDIRSLSVVQAILAEGSYQKAAQRLNCSQSTVTFQVRRLENELSLRLFERVGRRMVLSRAGKNLLPHLESVLSGMRHILQYGGEGSLSGQVRIAVAESLLSCLAPSMLAEFAQKAPRVRLELHCRNCHDIRNGVLSGEYDMGVYYNVGGHTKSLSLEKLGRAEGALVAPPSLAPGLRDFDTPHQEKDVAFIINEPRSVFRERMEAYLRARDILLSSTVEIWNIEAIKRCVAAGMGVSFLPRFAVRRELAEGTLAELAVNMPERGADIICVHHGSRDMGPALRLFRELFAERIASEGL